MRGTGSAAPAAQRSNPYGATSGDAKFRAWPALNGDAALAAAAGPSRRQRLESRPPLDKLFVGSSLQSRLSRAFAERRALETEVGRLRGQKAEDARVMAQTATLVQMLQARPRGKYGEYGKPWEEKS